MFKIRKIIKSVARMVPRFSTLLDYWLFQVKRISFSNKLTPHSDSRFKSVLSEIELNGFCVIEDFFSKEECLSIRKDYEKLLSDDPNSVQSYSDKRVFGIEERSRKAFDFYSNDFLKSIADAYCSAKLANAFTLFNKVETLPGSKGSGEGWHKDSSFRQFKAFLYLSDVGENDAPFQVILKSNKIRDYLKDMSIAGMQFRELRIKNEQIDKILRAEPDRLHTFKGKTGMVILADTALIHRGKPPEGGTRYALTNYYVNKDEINDEFIEAFQPINPNRTLELKTSINGLKV